MLDFLRKRTRSWVIKFLLGMIVIVFVLWGVGSFIKEPGGESVVTINGESVSRKEFEIQYQRLVDFYRDLFKGNLTPAMLKNLNLKGALLEQLIQKHILLQEARRLGIEVTDRELMDAIARTPEFQVNGRFLKERYLQVLGSKNLGPGQFETEQREQLTIQRLYDILQDSIHVTEAEVRDRYRLEREKINLYFVRLAAKDFSQKIQVTEDEIKKYYERNRETFKEPLRIQVEYLSYPFDLFSSQVEVSEKEIEQFYNTNRSTRFREPKAVRLRHMLFRAPEGDTGLREKARLKAEGVRRDAQSGKDFARLAQQYSDDSARGSGGEAQWFTQGQLLPDLERVAFGLKKGEISEVVETPAGFYVLKVEDIRDERTKTLAEARGEIIRAIKENTGRNEAGKAVDADRDKILSGADLPLIASQRKIPYKTTPFFSRSEPVPGVDSAEEFSKAAYSLEPKGVSSPLEGPHAYYLLKVKQTKQPFVHSLDDVRSEIEKGLRETKALELATKQANELLNQLKKEKDIKKLASEHALTLEETGSFFRNDSQIPKVGVLQEMKPGGMVISSLHPIADRIFTQKGGSLYIFAFKESQGADMELFQREKEQLRQKIIAEKKQKVLQRFVESLKARARIDVQPNLLEES